MTSRRRFRWAIALPWIFFTLSLVFIAQVAWGGDAFLHGISKLSGGSHVVVTNYSRPIGYTLLVANDLLATPNTQKSTFSLVLTDDSQAAVFCMRVGDQISLDNTSLTNTNELDSTQTNKANLLCGYVVGPGKLELKMTGGGQRLATVDTVQLPGAINYFLQSYPPYGILLLSDPKALLDKNVITKVQIQLLQAKSK